MFWQVTIIFSATAYSTSGFNSTSGIINVNVGSNALTSPYGGTPALVPGTIEAENFDLGGPNKAYYDSDTQNAGSQYRSSEQVDIEACSDTGLGYNVGWTANNEWMAYTVSVKDSGTYQIGARVSSTSTTGSMHFEIDANNIIRNNECPQYRRMADMEISSFKKLYSLPRNSSTKILC